MRLPALATVLALAWGLTGCSEEPPPYEDGSQTVPLAGLGPELEEAGIDVVSPDAPQAATADQAVAALEDAGFDEVDADTDLEEVADTLAVDGTHTAGLLALAGPDGAEAGEAVVLVFTSPEAAAVFAAGEPEVFSDPALETGRTDLLSGNLVAYAVDARSSTGVRRALESLGGAS